MTKHTRKVLTQNETLDLFMVLSAHCVKANDMAVYEEGWDDDRVARESGIEGVHNGHVEAMRLRRIGRTAEETRPSPSSHGEDRALLLQVAGHVTALQVILERQNDTLALIHKRVADVEAYLVDVMRRIDALGHTVDERQRATINRLEDIGNSLTDMRPQVGAIDGTPRAVAKPPEWPNF